MLKGDYDLPIASFSKCSNTVFDRMVAGPVMFVEIISCMM